MKSELSFLKTRIHLISEQLCHSSSSLHHPPIAQDSFTPQPCSDDGQVSQPFNVAIEHLVPRIRSGMVHTTQTAWHTQETFTISG